MLVTQFCVIFSILYVVACEFMHAWWFVVNVMNQRIGFI